MDLEGNRSNNLPYWRHPQQHNKRKEEVGNKGRITEDNTLASANTISRNNQIENDMNRRKIDLPGTTIATLQYRTKITKTPNAIETRLGS